MSTSTQPRPAETEPLGADQDEAYQRWLEELAETCAAENKPCEGCQQGGICDGFFTDRGPSPDSFDFPSDP